MLEPARVRAQLSSLLIVCSSAACYVGSSDAPRSQDVVDFAPQTAGASTDDITAKRALRHLGSGWIDHEESPIQPWCGAVLVAPDVAVTSVRCVEGWDRRYLNVGFGRVGPTQYEIEEIVIQRDEAVPHEHALAALRLAEPVLGVEPVELAAKDETVCGVQSITYVHVLRDQESARGLWTGCLSGDLLRAETGTPNCHGDMGAGAFAPDGALLGIAVDAFAEGGCVAGHQLATVVANEAFFDAALDLSQPPG